jgi:hypothetical protein
MVVFHKVNRGKCDYGVNASFEDVFDSQDFRTIAALDVQSMVTKLKI